MLQNIAVYPDERDVFYREETDNCYSTEAFILQYTALELPFEIIASIVFGFVAAYAVDMERSVQMAFIAAFNCFCIVNCGDSLGIMFCTLFNHVGFSVQITSVLLSISIIMSGIMSLDVPDVLNAFNYLSPVKYSVSNLAPYAMRGQTFTCTDAQRLPTGRCPIETGEEVLDLYNQHGNPELNLMALGICAIAYRLVAYALLKVRRSHGLTEKFRKILRSKQGSKM
jgi:hypothetical protein